MIFYLNKIKFCIIYKIDMDKKKSIPVTTANATRLINQGKKMKFIAEHGFAPPTKKDRKNMGKTELVTSGYSTKEAEKIINARKRGEILAKRYKESGYTSYKQWLKDNAGTAALKTK
jgi:hypothetical protein